MHLPPAQSEDLVVFKKTEVVSQHQSSFFGRLLLELRESIYVYALGREQLQIEVSGDEEGDIWRRRPKLAFELRCSSAQQLLAFPKLCKLAYIHTFFF